MQALILAGGEGTRLRPLTMTVPKPVVPLANRPFISYMIDWLDRHGFDDIVMSCGFLADGVREVLGTGDLNGVTIHYVDEPEPLGTAGAVKLAEPVLGERFAVLNGDVLTDLDISTAARRSTSSAARSRRSACIRSRTLRLRRRRDRRGRPRRRSSSRSRRPARRPRTTSTPACTCSSTRCSTTSTAGARCPSSARCSRRWSARASTPCRSRATGWTSGRRSATSRPRATSSAATVVTQVSPSERGRRRDTARAGGRGLRDRP